MTFHSTKELKKYLSTIPDGVIVHVQVLVQAEEEAGHAADAADEAE